jgi:hypothetical protein
LTSWASPRLSIVKLMAAFAPLGQRNWVAIALECTFVVSVVANGGSGGGVIDWGYFLNRRQWGRVGKV